MGKVKKDNENQKLAQQLAELTDDLKRTRADFENYRKRVEIEKDQAREAGLYGAVLQILPVIDNIERAGSCMPDELKDNAWAQGVAGLMKNLEKSLENIKLTRIDAKPGSNFNPDIHNAVQFDDTAKGENEVIAEELMAGYSLNGIPIRHAMVKVTRK